MHTLSSTVQLRQVFTALLMGFVALIFATQATAETSVRIGPLVLETLAPNPAVHVDGTHFTLVASSEPGTAEAPLTAINVSLGLDNVSTSGCSADDFIGFPNGNIALIQRGGCGFTIKANHAANAGASAVLIFNQGDTTSNYGLINATLSPTYTGNIPVFFLTYSLGAALVNAGEVTMRVDAPVFRGTRAEAYLRYCMANRDQCALSVRHINSGWQGDINPDRPHVTASVFKTVMLIGYAEAVVAGKLDPLALIHRDEWGRFSVLRDGGALQSAYARFGSPTYVTIEQMMNAMMRESDNAAPDWLLATLGRDTFAELVQRVMPGFHDAPESINAIMTTLDGHPLEIAPAARILEEYSGFQSAGYRAEVATIFDLMQTYDYAQQVRDHTCRALPWAELPPNCQGGFVTTTTQYRQLLRRFFMRSNSRSYANLMENLLDGTLVPPEVYAVMEPHIEYRMGLPAFSNLYTRYGGKGGSLGPQNVCNWVGYVQAIDSGERIVVATFVHDSLHSCGAGGLYPSVFMERLALDADFLALVRAAPAWESIFGDGYEMP